MPPRPSASAYTISAGVPFLPALADALVGGTLVPGLDPRADPLALAGATLILPTRRALREFGPVLLDRLGGGAALMPRLLALGEAEDGEGFAEPLDLPEAASSLDRQLALTRLVLAWGRQTRRALLAPPGEDEPLLIPASPGDAAGLAADLARLLDALEFEGVPFERVAALRTAHAGRYDRYWDIALDFLSVATAGWPAVLAAMGRPDPALRANRLLAAEAARLAAAPGAVIVAGVVATRPAEVALVAAALAHPRGAVVLSGLDLGLDEAAWAALPETPGHAQAALACMLDRLGLPRDAVRPLVEPAPPHADRMRLVGNALRPAAAMDGPVPAHLRVPAEREAAAFEGVALVEAANETEEALAIALILREALEHPGHRAALVTPDRALAARVVAELDRWGIAADDSAGRPLLATPPGLFARLVLDAALADFAPVPVLALLKHPFAGFGLGRGVVRSATEALELGALRGPLPPPGLAGLRAALAAARASRRDRHTPAWRRRLSDMDWDAAAGMLDALDALSPFAGLLRARAPAPAATFFAAHRAAIGAAAAGTDDLFRLEAGQALADLLDELATVGPEVLEIEPLDYPGLFAALGADRAVRGGEPRHPRVAVYGLVEARLLDIDRVVLGGLDEGTWPPEVSTDPWLNRPMREDVGLPAPERRVGLAAHDFAMGLGAPEVFVTRAHKRGGSPTVPARWLQRLKAELGPAHEALVRRGEEWRALAHSLDRPAGRVAIPEAPKPRPPLALRPLHLSVTEIEHLVRDPYSIYARRVLDLVAVEPIGTAPGAADRGTLIHTAVERFAEACRDGVPPDAEARLLAIGDALFAAYADYPDVQAFWRPRFARIAAALARWEAARRPLLDRVEVERRGAHSWRTAAGRGFTLSARADRIEFAVDGLARIVDFKTGRIPSHKEVRSGMSPQLALEAAMLMAGAFGEGTVPAPGAPLALMAVPLAGRPGPDLVAAASDFAFKDMAVEEVAALALTNLKALIDRFENEATPYASLLHPMFKTRRYGDYDHLARVGEWSLAGEDEA